MFIIPTDFFLPDVNECDPNPCQNGAVCNDGVNSYTCNCAAGYSGVNCEAGSWLQYIKGLTYHVYID